MTGMVAMLVGDEAAHDSGEVVVECALDGIEVYAGFEDEHLPGRFRPEEVAVATRG